MESHGRSTAFFLLAEHLYEKCKDSYRYCRLVHVCLLNYDRLSMAQRTLTLYYQFRDAVPRTWPSMQIPREQVQPQQRDEKIKISSWSVVGLYFSWVNPLVFRSEAIAISYRHDKR